MLLTTEDDEWTIVDTNGDLTGSTIVVPIEIAGGRGVPLPPLEYEVKDPAKGIIWIRTGGLALGKYWLQVKATQGLNGPWTYPQIDYVTLIVRRSVPVPA